MKVSTNEQLTTYRILDATIGFADMASPFNWGADGAGHDVELFGATTGHYLLWDTSEDDLILAGATATLSIDSTVDSSSAVTGSLHTDGGIGIAKALWVGTTSRLVGAVTMDAALSVDDTTDTSSGVTGSIHTDGGIGIAKALWVATTSRLVGAVTVDAALGIAGLITSTSVTGFRSNPTFVPDANRTNYAFAVGQGHTATNELSVTMVADGAQNFDPFQMNINIIGANPSVTSTTNLMYAKLTHDFADMAALRLKCTDFTVEVGKNVLDAYVFQGEIDFTAGVTVGGEACVVGLVLDAGASAVTCDAWRGLNITMRGAGTPAKSQAIFIDGAADITIREAIWICGGGITAAIRLARVDNYANAPINLLALPPAGYTPVSSLGAAGIHGGTTVKIACLMGTDTYYLLASTTPTA